MDGPRPTTPRLALLAALVALLAALAGATVARADGPSGDPSVRYPADGVAVQTAMAMADEYWGWTPCGGHVDLGWEDLGSGTNATSSWANDGDPYLQPSRNTACEIALSTSVQWDWPKLCTVIVHEMGHLTGHQHSPDPSNVMYPEYVAPLEDCALHPEPVQPAATPAATTPATPTLKPATASGPAVASRATARGKAAKTARRTARKPAKRTARKRARRA